jgi:hypothetical protein
VEEVKFYKENNRQSLFNPKRTCHREESAHADAKAIPLRAKKWGLLRAPQAHSQ